MPEDVLSQSEIDALLSAISTGEMTAEDFKKEDEEKKVKVYDFKRALRFSKDQIRSLTRIYDNFARLLTTYFSAQLRTYINIIVASADQIPYEEYIRSVPKMTILNVIDVQPLDGRMIMEIHPNIAYAMIDRILGGKGTSYNKIENLTEIEMRLMTNLFERTLEFLQDAWSGIAEIDPVLSELEINPQFLQGVSPNETVVVISMNASVGETSGMINICIPHVLLEPIIPKLSAQYWMETSRKHRKPDEVELLQQKIKEAKVQLTAQLGSSKLTIEDFLSLDYGDVIELDTRIDEPLVLKIGEIPKFTGQPGKLNKKLAVQILDTIEEGDEKNEW
ncbi:flagellar motor switch protein FliM [Lederbergia citrea]|uniref:Flagellar motor switch protein FliM n=1 Tax=Lederbergia citrea TaxID=2833581 RepID=A0A942Z2M8_9BACI|nr:flagellar motor switch protein FliM [Lederbergia citrea]MBS4177113.1 flagellar motor switch protein FliM [Lederbergia citrea]MBS4203776.1 flagellar motor switch protein FliM [Lederbergia citrea]MBS4221639.1 flagellar motor switch protein FliM [Lederbergia citrea]